MHTSIITIGGLPGSGKSSTANGVAEALGYARFSSGDLMRQIGLARGLSVEEVSALAKTEASIDEEIDKTLRDKAKEKNLVIDSRIAFHWIPKSFKVFLKIDPYLAAQRTFAHIQNSGRVGQNGNSVEEIYEKTQKRVADEQRRYTSLYNVDYLDEKNYDLVIHTAEHDLAEVIRLIVEKYREQSSN